MCGSSVMHSVLSAINRRDLLRLGGAASAGLLISSPADLAHAQTAPVLPNGSHDAESRLRRLVLLMLAGLALLTTTSNWQIGSEGNRGLPNRPAAPVSVSAREPGRPTAPRADGALKLAAPQPPYSGSPTEA